jgi:hypothetical protein
MVRRAKLDGAIGMDDLFVMQKSTLRVWQST